MALNIKELINRAKGYVELEAETKVIEVSFAERFTLFGREDVVLSIRTTDTKEPEWWVVGGSTPMNLYSKSRFSSADEAFSMHSGLMLRMAADDFKESAEAPEEVGYDAFISHASEDKDSIVRPLASILTQMGFKIWYDEFELRVGDSLRQSIDKGLVNSRFGIVILSHEFFAKNWPQYELNGLTAREIEGQKVILPVWHNIDKKDVLAYSPPLADKVALDTKRLSIQKIADELAKVFAIGAKTIGVVPGWESAKFRFLRGEGELRIGSNEGPAFTMWEALLHFNESEYPIFIEGELFDKNTLLFHAAQNLGVVRNWLGKKEFKQIWKMCVDANFNPKQFDKYGR